MATRGALDIAAAYPIAKRFTRLRKTEYPDESVKRTMKF